MTSAVATHEVSPAAGLALWRRVAAGPGDDAARPDRAGLDPVAVARFAELVTPAFADLVLGPGFVDAGVVSQSRLVNRFNAAAQQAALRSILDAGFDIVVLKGFALAHTLYPEPERRAIGDLDILVPIAARDRLIDFLGARGYAFRPLPTPRWGFISTASYMPFVSADGAVNLDIHVEPDCYPAFRALDTARVFAEARIVRAGDCEFRAPCDTHALVLCATNAAKDKFGAFCARKCVDAMWLLKRGNPDLAVAEAIAEAGHFHTPLRAFFALLRALGADLPAHHDASALPARARGEFDRVLDDALALWPSPPGHLAMLRRELAICTEPSVGLHNALARLAGLVRPGSGVPHGAATR